jgi:hypothetical protein
VTQDFSFLSIYPVFNGEERTLDITHQSSDPESAETLSEKASEILPLLFGHAWMSRKKSFSCATKLLWSSSSAGSLKLRGNSAL